LFLIRITFNIKT